MLSDLVGATRSANRLDRVLAKGRTGVVFEAHGTNRNRRVAIKMLQGEFSKNEHAMQRFPRAMRTMIPLRLSNLVMLHGAGKKGPSDAGQGIGRNADRSDHEARRDGG